MKSNNQASKSTEIADFEEFIFHFKPYPILNKADFSAATTDFNLCDAIMAELLLAKEQTLCSISNPKTKNLIETSILFLQKSLLSKQSSISVEMLKFKQDSSSIKN